MLELAVVLAVCVALAAVLVPWALSKRGQPGLAEVAARHGLHHSASDPFGCTRVAFPLFRRGDGRVAEDVVWRDRPDGLSTRAFSYTFWEEHQDAYGNVTRQHQWFTCAMAQVDGSWPEVSITREGILEKALDLVGLGDIELESDEFNRRFALRSPDRRFAVTLVDARMIELLLGTDAQFAFFVKGRWLLVVSNPLAPQQVPALMRMAEAFVERVPRVVYELWPSPFRDASGRPLAAGDDGYGAALALAEAAERDPWTSVQPNPHRDREPAVEYDLDGNVVEPRPEDPWGPGRSAST